MVADVLGKPPTVVVAGTNGDAVSWVKLSAVVGADTTAADIVYGY